MTSKLAFSHFADSVETESAFDVLAVAFKKTLPVYHAFVFSVQASVNNVRHASLLLVRTQKAYLMSPHKVLCFQL